jgi:hypothetical protein
MDFGDYLGKHFSDRTFVKPYLDRINEEFFKRVAERRHPQ